MRLSPTARSWALVPALAACLLGSPARALNPNALWHVVHDLCLRDKRLTGSPAPCLAVNRQGGYAVVPDLRHRTQILLVPTTRVSGIENPALLAPDSENYWRATWSARRFFEKRAGRPVRRDLVGMAVNSIDSRTQNQLHIHVDCIRPEARRVLSAHEGRIGFVWTPLREPIDGRRFRVRRLDGEDLGDRDPFKLLARGSAQARAHMGRQGLAVVGATFSDGSPGFYLLAGSDGSGFGEGLLDHQCAVLREP